MSILVNAEKNKSTIQKILRDLDKANNKIQSSSRIKRFFKYEEDKQKLENIQNLSKQIESELEQLFHIVVHDEYWDDLRKKI